MAASGAIAAKGAVDSKRVNTSNLVFIVATEIGVLGLGVCSGLLLPEKITANFSTQPHAVFRPQWGRKIEKEGREKCRVTPYIG